MTDNLDKRSAETIQKGLLRGLWLHLDLRRRRQMGALLILMLGSSLIETVSLGLVLPFLAVLTAPEKVLTSYPRVIDGLGVFGVKTSADLLLPLAIAFAVAALTAAGARVLLLWLTHRVANATAADLSIMVFRRTLYQPYRVHISRNSSEVITGLSAKISAAAGVLQQSLVLISSGILLVAVLLALLAIDAKVAISSGLVFGGCYALISWFSRRQLERNAQRIARESTQVLKALLEGLGAIRDVLLDGTQSFYSNLYRKSDQVIRAAQANNAFISGSPRMVMEALGMILIAVLAYVLGQQPGGVAAALPVLGALALGAQRLLPALQQCYTSWAYIVGNKALLADAVKLLDQPLPADAFLPPPPPLPFRRSIRFEDVRMRYANPGPWVIDGINFEIRAGARVGFVGATGSGKSTLLDLAMGLLEPTSGRILVDEIEINETKHRAWQRNIAHVPQHIFLADISLAENIAFGVPYEQIDMARVRMAAQHAQIAEFIESRPGGYEEMAGERGIRLSGGQLQRIGIARALYKDAEVIVFDEATSALDNGTEQEVMKSIEGMSRGLTIIIVAHRLTTVRQCDFIVELSHGKIVYTGSFDHLLEHSPSFRRMALDESERSAKG